MSENASQTWIDYWKNDGVPREVFVNRAGDRHAALTEYWHNRLADLPVNARIIDLACGAGSVFSDLVPEPAATLFGADISAQALTMLRERVPAVCPIRCSVVQLPFQSQSFDLVASQFGIEYAGMPAFAAAANLVAKGGRLECLCHIKDGYIDSRNADMLTAAQTVIQSGFVDLAIRMTEAEFSRVPARIERARSEFTNAHDQVAAMLRIEGGVHSHVYFGFRQLFERRAHYDVQDITGWLDKVRLDLDRTILRLTEMRQIAASEAEITELCQLLNDAGLTSIEYSRLDFPGFELPVAWSVHATRAPLQMEAS